MKKEIDFQLSLLKKFYKPDDFRLRLILAKYRDINLFNKLLEYERELLAAEHRQLQMRICRAIPPEIGNEIIKIEEDA